MATIRLALFVFHLPLPSTPFVFHLPLPSTPLVFLYPLPSTPLSQRKTELRGVVGAWSPEPR